MRTRQVGGVGSAMALVFAAGAQPEALMGLSSHLPPRAWSGLEDPAQRLLLALDNRSFERPNAGAPGTLVSFSNVPGWTTPPDTLQAGIRNVPVGEYQPGALLSPQAAFALSGLDINFVLIPAVVRSDIRPNLFVEAGREYALSVQAGRRIGTTFGGARLTALGGGASIVSVSDAVAPAEGTFREVTLTVPALLPGHPAVGQPMQVELANLTPTLYTEFDDVEVAINSNVPEPALPPNSDAQLDTGFIGNNVGLTSGGATLWMQRYVPPADWSIGSVSTRFSRDFMLFDTNQRVDVFIWGDDDGVPGAGSVLLGSGSADFNADDFFADAFQTVALDEPVSAGAYPFYFIGAAVDHIAGAFPAALDTTVVSNGRTWVAGSANLDTLDTTDLLSPQNTVLPTTVAGAVGVDGVWLLRADFVPGPPPDDAFFRLDDGVAEGFVYAQGPHNEFDTVWMHRVDVPGGGAASIESVWFVLGDIATRLDTSDSASVYVWGDDDGDPSSGMTLLEGTTSLLNEPLLEGGWQNIALPTPVLTEDYPYAFFGVALNRIPANPNPGSHEVVPVDLTTTLPEPMSFFAGFGESFDPLLPNGFQSGDTQLHPFLLRAEGAIECGAEEVGVAVRNTGSEMEAVDNLLYTLARFEDIAIHDIANPESPIELSVTEAVHPIRIASHGDLLFWGATFDGIKVMDVCDATSPVELGQVTTGRFWDFAFRDHLAFVATGIGRLILDISDPTNPIVLHSSSVPTWGVDVVGNLAYFTSGPDYVLEIIDVSNPAAPVPLSTLAIPGARLDRLNVIGTRAYMIRASTTIEIVDVSDPMTPQHEATFHPGANRRFSDYHVVGDALFGSVIEGFFLGAMVTADVSTPAAPVLVDELPGGDHDGVLAANGVVFAFAFENPLGLRIIDPGCFGEFIVDDDFDAGEDTDSDRYYATIQAAIDDAVDSGVITVRPGTYAGGLNTQGKAITIRSTNPLDSDIVQQTIIRQIGGTGLRMNNGETHDTVIDGLTFQQCSRGIQIETGSGPWIRHCLFLSNDSRAQGVSGAGISIIDAGGTRIESCFFQSNRAPNFGAGLSIVRGSAQVVSTVFRGNSAPRGAALCISDSTGIAEVINCTIIGNTLGAGSNGGETPSALHIRTGGSAEVHNTIVWSNGTLTDVADSSTGTITGSHNIVGTSTAGPSLLFINVDPELGGEPLGLGPLAGSPAIDAGNTGAYPHDVRGRGNVPRYRDDPQSPNTGLIDPTIPTRGIIDIGIGEFQPVPFVCEPDLSGSSDPNDPAYGVPDGLVDASDFFYFLDQFAASNLAIADLTGSADPNDPTYGVPDGIVDASDFFYYLDSFVAGCP